MTGFQWAQVAFLAAFLAVTAFTCRRAGADVASPDVHDVVDDDQEVAA